MAAGVRFRSLLWLALVVAALGYFLLSRHGSSSASLSVAPADVLRLGALTLEPCEIGRKDVGVATVHAYCALVPVPENRAAPALRTLHLKIAVVRADAAQPLADIVTFLDGGPGGAATEDYPAIAAAFAPLRKRHSILLIDQRGTGGSNPLQCDDEKDSAAAPGADAIRACARALLPHADPRYYTTSDAVEDLEAVRQALGRPMLDLVAVSYGTRVAQRYARQYGAGVRAMVLDGAVPNSLALGGEHAANLEAVLRELFTRCRTTQECAKRYNDPYQTLKGLQARLRAQPQKISVRDPYTFRSQEKTLTANELAQLVRVYMYSPYTASLLPYVLQQAAAGDYAPLAGQAQVAVGDLSESLAGGMALSVNCAEDAGGLKVQPQDAATVLGNGLTAALLSACALWPHGTAPADFAQPLQGPLPVLMLAGEQDPVTPPRYSDAIARTLTNARVLKLNGQGHAVLGVSCVPRLMNEFILSLNARALDARCLKALSPAPFFIDTNGSGP